MKSTVKSILLIAAAAMAFSACNEEPLETPKTSEGTNGTHKVTFIASQVETKTTMGINDGVASFDWEKADVDFFHIFENEYSYKAKATEGKIGNDGLMQITATFENGGTAPFSYFGFFAPTFYTYPTVPAAQTDNGKYDPLADILIAKPVTADASQSGKAISFQFKRIVAINVMTLKGLTAGETVSEVKIVSDKPIAGKYDYVNEKWYNSTDMQITVSANSVADENGQAVIYFVSAPVEDAQLTVTATTAAGKTYSKDLAKTITFAEGGVKAFGVTVEAEATEPVVVEFGNLGYESWGETASFSGTTKTSVTQTVDNVRFDYIRNDGSCYANTTSIRFYKANELRFTAPDGYYITNIEWTGSGFKEDVTTNVESCTSTATELSWEGEAYSVTFTRPSTASSYLTLSKVSVTIVAGEIQIVNVASVELDQNEVTLEVGDTEALVATVLPENATNKTLTWSSSNEDVATVKDGDVTAVGVGEATITVTTVDGEFTASCDVTVNAPAVKVYSSLADLIADGEPSTAGVPVTVTLTDETIKSIYISGQYRNGVYLDVPGYTVEIYSRDVPEEWEAFGTLSGTLTECTWKKYYDTWELCPADWDELDYTAPVKYNVVVPTGLVGGTVSADIYEAAAGATVTLTATPATGYQFASWSVKDASENDVTVTNNAFTMPASDVTVSATFEKFVGAQTTILDFSTKEEGNSAYKSSWKYGDWTVVNGANNNKGWDYIKMGGKSATLSEANPCYVYNNVAISHDVARIQVDLPSGSLSKTGMSVNSWGVYVYSDEKMTNQIDYVAGGTITNAAGSFDFVPSTGIVWSKGYFYKVSWDLANTTTTNGIICVSKITLFER